MQATITVKQTYIPSPEVLKFLDDFRKMINDVIRIALQENVTSRFSITSKAYQLLIRYPYPTAYRLSACNVATGVLRNYRRELRKKPYLEKPYIKRSFVKMWVRKECVAQIIGNNLRLSLTANDHLPEDKKQFTFIPLSSYILRSISGFTARSVTLTACTLSIAYSKETVVTEPTGLIGIDRNLNNVTTANLKGETEVYDLSEATLTKQKYYFIRSQFKRNDDRIRKKIYGKYGRLQRNKVQQILHTASKKIITNAQAINSGIVMENLKGIRKLYRKGNGQGNFYRGRMNSWSFYELQRQIEYKAKWVGIPLIYVKPNKTSATCAVCGSEVTECVGRKVWCSHCMKSADRDENAALNIVKRGSFLAPDGLVSEAMKGKEQRSTENNLILQVDTSKSGEVGCMCNTNLLIHHSPESTQLANNGET